MRSGGADYVYRLCEELARSGVSVDVFTSATGTAAPRTAYRVHRTSGYWGWLALCRLLGAIYRIAPDVLNIHFVGVVYGNHPAITYLPWLARVLQPGLRIAITLEHLGGADPQRFSLPSRAVRKALGLLVDRRDIDREFGTIFSHSDAIIVLSETHRSHVIERCPAAAPRCFVIPPPAAVRVVSETNGEARRRGRQQLGIDPSAPVIGYFGYLYPTKGIETLLQSVAIVARDLPDVRLLLIGSFNEVMLKEWGRPDYETELRDLTEQLEIAERVTYSGYFSNEDDTASLYLRACDAAVLPFDGGVRLNNSSFNTVAVHGLPIITTRPDELEAPFAEGENVLLSRPRNPDELAERILSVFSDDQLRRRLSEGALTFAERYVSWALTVRAICGDPGEANGGLPASERSA